MFGLGLTEITFLLVLVGIVWVLVKRDQVRRMTRRKNAKAQNSEVDTLEPCPVCGVYVALDAARPCGRPDCPFTASGNR